MNDMKPAGELTLPQLLRRAPGRNPCIVPALYSSDEDPPQNALSYQRLNEQIATVSMQLRDAGIDRQHRVATVLPNGPEAAVAFLAIASSATYAPLNPDYRVAEYEFYLRDLHVTALVVRPDSAEEARQAAKSLGIRVIELLPRWDAAAGLFELSLLPGTSAEPLRTGEPGIDAGVELKAEAGADLGTELGTESGVRSEADTEADPDDIALILHTSGTTSRPKKVPLSHRNLCASAFNVAAVLELTENDRCLNVMPLFHIHGLVGNVMSTITAGASVVCAPGFNATRVPSWIEAHQPTWYSAVPAMHQQILRPDTAQSIRKNSLRLIRSSSAPLPPLVLADMEQVFNVPVIEAYGMTEASHQIASNPLPPGQCKPGSVGVARGSTIRILDDQQVELPAGETGEVHIRGESVMADYENNPDENATVFTQGWFRTGDLGHLDTDGYLFINGRLKEIINRAGEKISPREVDEVLLSHPEVQEAATFAAPHTQLGEEVGAAVVLVDGASINEQALISFAAERLADFKVPSVMLFVDEIPKGPTGKLQRSRLANALGLSSAVHAAERAPYRAPQSPIERSLTTIWMETLRTEPIGIDDNFYQVGGDSVLAAQILNRIRGEFSVELSFIDFFRQSSIAILAPVISQLQADALSELGGLSDEEIQKLLG